MSNYKLAYAGDLVLQEVDSFNEKILYKDFIKIIEDEKANLVINLESPFIEKGMVKQKDKICLYSYANSINHLKYLSPKLVNLSNNHINDFGIDSCKLTMDILENNHFRFFGVGTDKNINNHISVDNQNKVIQIAYVTRTSDFTGSKLFADDNFIGGYDVNLEEIQNIRKKYMSYKIIINIHWGIENIKYPEPEKRKLAYQIIDSGADIIIGHHPHIIQPIEIYKNKYIFYSIGNFYFPDIHFEDKNKLIRLKTIAHQRRGIVPIISIDKNIKIDNVYEIIRNTKGDKIDVNKLSIDSLFLDKKYDDKWWDIYYKNILFKTKMNRVVHNPSLILKKISTLMKKILIHIYKTSFLGRLILTPIKWFYDIFRFRLIGERKLIKMMYKQSLGFYPDLKNPKLFTEKIQWLKLNDRTPLHTICADKYKVRKYVEEKIGKNHLIPLVFETKDTRDICEKNMPDYPVIIKTNHDSGGGYVVKDKTKTDYSRIRKDLKMRLKKNYYTSGKEWEYKDIERRIIVEKLMTDKSNNNLLNDYKIHCFNGVPTYIQTIFDRETGAKETWYNLNWEEQEFSYFSNHKKKIEKPSTLEDMIKISELLSKDFKYVRVDLYDINDKVYFGELTFHPFSGYMLWTPRIWDKKLGDLLKL